MNTVLSLIFGFIGLITGYFIIDVSFKIIENKKRNVNIEINRFFYTKWFRLLICICNGIIWALIGRYNVNAFASILVSLQITVGIMIAFIDLNIRIIPNELVLSIIILGILFQMVSYGIMAILPAFICMIIMMVVFVSVASFVGFGKVGAGDVKFAGAMGMALGYPLIVISVFGMSAMLFVFIISGLAMKKIALASMIPLAPFMVFGFITALISSII